MNTIAQLLARKQKLLERMQDGPSPQELADIDRRLAEINEALNAIERSALPPGRAA